MGWGNFREIYFGLEREGRFFGSGCSSSGVIVGSMSFLFLVRGGREERFEVVRIGFFLYCF